MPLSRLPFYLTSFVGRTAELDQLTRLLARSRLVTLTGGPGVGKTRLARELVQGGEASGRAVGWLELASLREPALVAPAVAEALELHGEVQPGDVEGLCALVGDREFLLVLDNCEHLVDDAASVAEALLLRCPRLAILATSREALGVPGERVWLVSPLALPAGDGPEEGECEAVRLFFERARDVKPDFRLSPDAPGAVAEICRRLDGIPLAIELAAARIRILSPEEILGRLSDVFLLLSDGRRGAAPRHRTLRAAIDWSYDLLSPSSRELLRRLAVFRGGLTVDAAEQLGPGGRIAPEEVLDLVGGLVDRSLVMVRERDGVTRYHLLEAVRQYALAKLGESEEEEVRRRHAHYFHALAEEARPHLTGPERRPWVHRLQAEMDNLRSALEWTRSRDPRLHVRLVGGLWWFWFSTQHWGEGGRWITGALELPAAAEPGADRAALLFAAGALAALQVRTSTARPALEECMALAAAAGDARLEAYATNYLGMTYAGEGRPEGLELCRRAEAWFRENHDLYGLRLALLLQGSTALASGSLDRAEELNREGVEVARRFGQPRELAVSLQNLAVVHMAQGRFDEARGLLVEALRSSRQDISYYFIATGLAYLGEIEGRRGHVLEAARLLGAADAVRERVGARPFPMDRDRLSALLPSFRIGAGEAAFETAWSAGRESSPEALLEEIAGGEEGAPPVPALRVEALGGFRVTVAGEPAEDARWPYAKPRELLVLLLLHPRGRSRDQIGEALWPGAAASNVKNSFHVTLHHLRKALGHPEWIGVEGERYRLDPGVEWRFDATVFEEEARAALRAGDVGLLRGAAALYRGELLEGEPGGRWLEEHRERLRRLHVDVLLALGKALEATDLPAALEIYRALAAREELDEEVHRRLMQCMARAGDRVGALRHHDRLVELLRTTLDAAPEPATLALAEALRTGG